MKPARTLERYFRAVSELTSITLLLDGDSPPYEPITNATQKLIEFYYALKKRDYQEALSKLQDSAACTQTYLELMEESEIGKNINLEPVGTRINPVLSLTPEQLQQVKVEKLNISEINTCLAALKGL